MPTMLKRTNSRSVSDNVTAPLLSLPWGSDSTMQSTGRRFNLRRNASSEHTTHSLIRLASAFNRWSYGPLHSGDGDRACLTQGGTTSDEYAVFLHDDPI